MSYKVKFIARFEKELKRLSKKHSSLKSDFSLFLASVKEDPTQGTSLGNDCYNNSSVIITQPKRQYLSIVCKGFLFFDNSGPYLSLQKFVQ